MTSLLVATRNAHKLCEIAAVLGPDFRCLSLDEFSGAPAVVEDAPDFPGNARKKALTLAAWLAGRRGARHEAPAFVLADDSGLEVDALGGAPGVHSARFAALDGPGLPPGQNATDAANNEKLLRLLAAVPPNERTARFRCVLALVPLDPRSGPGRPQLFCGVCEGRIARTPAGSGGFGYDPLFLPEGQDCSFAELGDALKNTLSHRARALAPLRQWLHARSCGPTF